MREALGFKPLHFELMIERCMECQQALVLRVAYEQDIVYHDKMVRNYYGMKCYKGWRSVFANRTGIDSNPSLIFF